MGIPTNKSELQAAIKVSYEKIGRVLQSILPEKTTEPALEGHAIPSQYFVLLPLHR